MPAEKFTHKASTPAKKRQWSHVEEKALNRGLPIGSAIKMANAAVRDHPAKSKKRTPPKRG